MVMPLLPLALQAAEPAIVIRAVAPPSYADCLAGRCPPAQDAAASIAAADTAFREGAYRPALRILSAAVSRNRASAAADPRPLARIYVAYAGLALHEGDMDLYSRAVRQGVRALRENLPASDPATIAAGIALGDMWVRLDNLQSADAAYQSASRRATAQKRHYEAAVAMLRRSWLAGAAGNVALADRLLDGIEGGPAAGYPAIRAGVPVVRLRLAIRRADATGIDTLIDGIRQQAGTTPTLLWAPAYPEGLGSGENWADIGYWITPDGYTRDADVLRGSRDRGWTKPVLQQVRRRRYTPLDMPADGPGTYRIERISARSTYLVPTGSHTRQKVGQIGYVTRDMTEEVPPAGQTASDP